MSLARWLRDALTRPAAPRSRLDRRPAVEYLEARSTPSTGGLPDPTFGTDGHVLSLFTGTTDRAFAVATQPDGKIIAAGDAFSTGSQTQGDFLVARYNPDGTLDTAFGSGGYTTTDFDRHNDRIFAVAVQADGRIVVGGLASKGGKTTTADFGLARYNANGTLDTTFGTKGKVVTDLGGASEQINTVLVDGSGRILVGGFTINATGQQFAALARYTASGTLDSTFGSGGKLVSTVRVTGGSGTDLIALQPDGRIVLAGENYDPATGMGHFVVARFNANGSTDTGFGSGGLVATQLGQHDNAGGLAIDPSGRILVAGWESALNASPRGYYLLRYNANGTLDGGFGSGGVVTLVHPSGWLTNNVAGVAVQADGQIVFGGKVNDLAGQQYHFFAVRVSAAGALDTGYGNGGWADAQFAPSVDVRGMTLQPDGRVLLAGDAYGTNGNPQYLALVRFLASAPQVGSFAAAQNPDGTLTLTASDISDGNPNATVTRVEFYYLDASGDRVSLGFAAQSSPGVWALTVSLPPGTYTLCAQATDSYGAVGDPTSLTLQLM